MAEFRIKVADYVYYRLSPPAREISTNCINSLGAGIWSNAKAGTQKVYKTISVEGNRRECLIESFLLYKLSTLEAFPTTASRWRCVTRLWKVRPAE